MLAWVLSPPFKKQMIKEGRCEQESNLFGTVFPPLTMVEIASILKQKFNVKVIDTMASEINIEQLKIKFKSDKPNCVFVNTTTPTFKNDLNSVNCLSKISEKTIFYIYGIHAKYFSNKIKTNKNTILLNSMPYKKAYELIGLKNQNLNNFPVPSWDLVDLKQYKIPIKNKPFLLIRTSIGCPYSCTFCTAPYYYGKNYEQKTAKNILKEIKNGLDLGVNEFLFYSEVFTLKKKIVMELCNTLIEKNIKINWMCNSRVDTIDFELLNTMKKSGCWLISYGNESSSQKELDMCSKLIKISQTKKSIILTKKSGIMSIGHFVIGLPGSNKSSILSTIKYSNKLGLDFAYFYLATPFPGSELYEKLKLKQLDYSKINYKSNLINENLDLESLQKFAYKYFYFNTNTINSIYKLVKISGINAIPLLVNQGLNMLKQF